MTSLDEEYKMTKLIKQGKKAFPQDFTELKNFISTNYNVNVLNIIYDTIDNGARPRLWIIPEFEQDANLLNAMFGFGEVPNAEKDILAKEFIKQVSLRLPQVKTINILVVIRSFESPAKQETNGSVTKEELQALQTELNIEELWQIRPDLFYTATFFLFTNDQVRQFLENGMKGHFTDKYFEILKKHDEFVYYDKSQFSIELESKENFESKYENNWFYFDRR